jgi:1,4-alpha-glucan branching enzyme
VERKHKKFPTDVFSMNFITNHDQNAWNGTLFERMGDAWKAMAVYTYFAPGIPLLYTGQEVGNNKRLAFFEKDNVMASRDAASISKFYRELGRLKRSLPEMGISEELNNAVTFDVHNKALISWVRETAEADRSQRSRTYVVVNMSDKNQKWGKRPQGDIIMTSGGSDKSIEPWGYRVIKMTYKSK